MRKKAVWFASVITLTAALSGIQESGRVIKDDLGYFFSLSVPPQRIISLAPNITEILFLLGLGDRVVGVTRYCDYPQEALRIGKIGGIADPSPERIKALDPDLVIAFRGNPLKTVRRLKSLRLPVFVLESGKSLEDVFRTVEKIGFITQSNREAQALIRSLQARYQEIESSLRMTSSAPAVFLSLHGQGLWTCGRDSFLHELLVAAGAKNIAGNARRKWLLYNREQLIHEDPEVIIILAKSPEEFEKAKGWYLKAPSLAGLRAVRKGRIFHLDESAASRFGPRLFDALAELVRLVHPELKLQSP